MVLNFYGWLERCRFYLKILAYFFKFERWDPENNFYPFLSYFYEFIKTVWTRNNLYNNIIAHSNFLISSFSYFIHEFQIHLLIIIISLSLINDYSSSSSRIYIYNICVSASAAAVCKSFNWNEYKKVNKNAELHKTEMKFNANNFSHHKFSLI